MTLPHEAQLDALKLHPRGIVHLAAAFDAVWSDAMAEKIHRNLSTAGTAYQDGKMNAVFTVIDAAHKAAVEDQQCEQATDADAGPLAHRLRLACNGHPLARIAWPHRLLHEAADAVDRLEKLQAVHLKTVGMEAIYTERRRQIEVEGWTIEHDADHLPLDLLNAGIGYICRARLQMENPGWEEKLARSGLPPAWPWSAEWWKPAPEPRRNLEKGGALVAAALDRIHWGLHHMSERLPKPTPGAALEIVPCTINGENAVFDLVSERANMLRDGERLEFDMERPTRRPRLPVKVEPNGCRTYSWFPLLGMHRIRFTPAQ